MPIDRDGDGPPLRRQEKVSLTPGEGRGSDLRATAFTDDVFNDDYYGHRTSRAAGSRSLSVVVGVVLGIAVAGGVGWYFLRGSGLTLTPGELSFVKSDPTPYKIRPESPGGMQVENQDKLVYDRVAKGNAPNRVENLLPPAEEPKAPPLKPKVETPPPPAPVAEAPKPAPEPAKEPAKEPVKEEPKAAEVKPAPPATPAKPEEDPLAAAVAAATGGRTSATGPITVTQQAAPTAPPAKGAPTQLVPAPETPTPVAPAPEPAAAPPPPVQTATAPPASPASVPATVPTIPPVTAPAAASGTPYQIQLASVLSEQAALAEWGRINNKNKDILSGYSPIVTRADLGERGVFYRLRAGPLADKPAAEALCASLTAANVGCIVVKP